ncbi:4'-phosphopantetheinyl transferase family protein [Streptomyces sp. H51]|uniref:4'-phosphopantetheinyl transferase family protein n=1 Tax=Streptomyces sp. H51 TaxID=3111770 RepID=UPI002D78E0B5|nr:4'-phosphopantetheinyl transferase superfamily protein [Streptomyces sp. H51]
MNRARYGPPPGETHVWVVPEPGPGPRREALLQRCAGLLAPEERRRSDRVVPSARTLYACSHAALRAVTALYTGRSPDRVAFVRGKFGKPYVGGDPGLRVSLSHTDGLALVAVSRDGPVGVDVERVTPLRDPAGLRRQILSPWEDPRCPGSAEDPSHGALFTHWTCKEAVLKALGTGLAGDLTAVWVAPGERRGGPVRVHRAPGDPGRAWRLWLIDAGPGFRAAVAVAGGGDVVRVLGRLPGHDDGLLPAAAPGDVGPLAAEPADIRTLVRAGASVRLLAPSTAGHRAPSTAGHPVPSTADHSAPSTADHSAPSTVGHPVPSAVGHSVPSAVGHSVPSTAGHPVPSAVGHSVPSTAGHPAPSAAVHLDSSPPPPAPVPSGAGVAQQKEIPSCR